ncbi:MAG: SH3 domain-containing protein [Deferribacteraceae bacterium]|jgi:hypothetical protein|nr:SH3 domain-containing protein [Deferribacteraceae bacterium]
MNKILFLTILLLTSFSAFALESELNSVVLPDNATTANVPHPDNVVEAVGNVIYSAVPIYSAANKTSRVVRNAIPGEKVTIIASNDSWYAVRLYNGSVGFIEVRNIRTAKVFYDEQAGANSMSKLLNAELADTVNKFNNALRESVYTDKYQLAPRLSLVSAAKRGETITLIMEYSAVDSKGNIIPSRQDNILQEEMKGFVELLFMKLLPSMSESYVIAIRQPDFSSTGQVLATRKTYAELLLEHAAVGDNITIRRNPNSDERLLSLVVCDIDKSELFKEFPN